MPIEGLEPPPTDKDWLKMEQQPFSWWPAVLVVTFIVMAGVVLWVVG